MAPRAQSAQNQHNARTKKKKKQKQRGQGVRSKASVKINTIFSHQRTRALNINTPRQKHIHNRVCVRVCVNVLNRRLYLILKWVKQEIAVYNRKTNTGNLTLIRTHILIKEPQRMQKVWTSVHMCTKSILFPSLAVLFSCLPISHSY